MDYIKVLKVDAREGSEHRHPRIRLQGRWLTKLCNIKSGDYVDVIYDNNYKRITIQKKVTQC